MRLALCILALFLAACSSPAPKQTAEPVILHWSGESIPDGFVAAWYSEACRRFTNPVIVACHGSNGNVWTATADPPRKSLPVQQIAEVLANVYPNRDIVYICCNERGHKITVPRAWVADNVVWAMPDSFPGAALWRETTRGQGYVGDIYEFKSWGRVPLAGER